MDVPFKELQSVPPADIKRFADDVLARAGGCDALYLPCPQWQAAQIVEALERERGMPAIAYTHASFFVAFKALGIKDADPRPWPAAGLAGGARNELRIDLPARFALGVIVAAASAACRRTPKRSPISIAARPSSL